VEPIHPLSASYAAEGWSGDGVGRKRVADRLAREAASLRLPLAEFRADVRAQLETLPGASGDTLTVRFGEAERGYATQVGRLTVRQLRDSLVRWCRRAAH
jgi:hypothetical protein